MAVDTAPSPVGPHEVVLGPGDFRFSGVAHGSPHRMRTLLGSCVAITMWHPRYQVGGMCHFVLPTRPVGAPAEPPAPGWYGDDAVALFLDGIARAGTRPDDYQVKVFGGGHQFDDPGVGDGVPRRNVDAALELLDRHGWRPATVHVGGTGARVIVFDLPTGDVWVRHTRVLRESA
jgi:chemotaxis protein CheD